MQGRAPMLERSGVGFGTLWASSYGEARSARLVGQTDPVFAGAAGVGAADAVHTEAG